MRHVVSEKDSCLEQSHNYLATSMSNAVRVVALVVWGTHPRDRMLIAEMSVTASITELMQAENTALKELLLKSRLLRSTLTTMGKKHMGMEKQLETLR